MAQLHPRHREAFRRQAFGLPFPFSAAMSRKKKKVYAVKVGRKPGVYRTWEGCAAQVNGYSKAVYKSFRSMKDAEEYLNGPLKPKPQAKPKPPTRRPEKTDEPVSSSLGLPDLSEGNALKHVTMYADGACAGNPGPGGYGVVLIYGKHRKELSAGFRLTTNNRMEILGCIVGLRSLKFPCAVTIYSDSKYVVNAMTKSWALKWRRLGWKRKLEDGKLADALNPDLWSEMLDLCDKHRVKFEWIRGHGGNKENERCDQLARAAAAGTRLGVDAFYETPKATNAGR
jgi:ribonuclease HI